MALFVRKDADMRVAGFLALKAMLKTGHFYSTDVADFGARPRDHGWHARTDEDLVNWFRGALELCAQVGGNDDDVRDLIAESIHGIWSVKGCQEALIKISEKLNQSRHWSSGWHAWRALAVMRSEEMGETDRGRIESVIRLLEPQDLLSQARALVLTPRTWAGGIADAGSDEDATIGWEKASQKAFAIGQALAGVEELRKAFIREVVFDVDAGYAFACGRGLADRSGDLAAHWAELIDAYVGSPPAMRNRSILGGYLDRAAERDPLFVSELLEQTVEDAQVSPCLPYLNSVVGLDEAGFVRLRRLVATGHVVAAEFRSVANYLTSSEQSEHGPLLLQEISQLEGGDEVALDILWMWLYLIRRAQSAPTEQLLGVARTLILGQKSLSGSELNPGGHPNCPTYGHPNCSTRPG